MPFVNDLIKHDCAAGKKWICADEPHLMRIGFKCDGCGAHYTVGIASMQTHWEDDWRDYFKTSNKRSELARLASTRNGVMLVFDTEIVK